MKQFLAGDALKVTAYRPKEVEMPHLVIRGTDEPEDNHVVVYSYEIGSLIAALIDAAWWMGKGEAVNGFREWIERREDDGA